LAHTSGRLLLERDAYEVDLPRLIEKARERGCFLELNSQPKRLDLTETYCRTARDTGVLVSINSDAHNTQDLDNLQYGIAQARRGWLEKTHVLNAHRLPKLRQLLKQTVR
jgi:DNA polymerase (family 10)